MKLGFFGGSFNPPTIAHFNLIKQAKIDYNFDKVYFVPVNDYYNKKGLINIETRIDMLNLICKNQQGIEILEIEKEINRKLDTIDVLKLISEKFKKDEVIFLIGEDNFKKMPTWKDYEKLLNYKYIILQRNDSKELKITEPNFIYMKNSENLKISSTTIRKKLENGEPIDNLVCNEVKDYILKNNLYQNKG